MTPAPDVIPDQLRALTASPAPSLAPPAAAYGDPGTLRAELEQIWGRQWVVACLTADVSEPRSYCSAEVAGVPVVITRDRGGVLHAMSNVCRHRGMILTEGCGSAMTLNCPNHAWSYALDGQLKGAPRASTEAGFDAAAIRLPQYGVVEWGPLVLVNLDHEAAPPRPEFEAMEDALAAAGLHLDALRPSGDILDWRIAANWKIVIENYLECYHCAWVHKDLSTVFDVADYRSAAEPVGHLLASTSPVKQSRDTSRRDALLDTSGRLGEAHWFMLLPGASISVYPGAGAVEFTWYWPMDPHTTGARTLMLVAADATAEYEDQLHALVEQVGEEDNHICEGMHRGMASGSLDRVRVMAENEPLISDFHGYLASRVDYEAGLQ